MKRVFLIIAMLLLVAVNSEAKALRIGDPVPAVRLIDLAGKQFDTGQLKGKTVVLYFWTDACGCAEQLIALRTFIAGLKDKPFTFVTINEGQGKTVAERFIRNNKLPYQVLLDNDLAIGTKSFGIKVLPTIFIIGKDGILKEKLIGVVDNKRLETFIRRYL